MSQLTLFDEGDPAKPERTGLVEPHVTDEDRAIASRLPRFVRFGTSSWSFPGWAGIVWKGAPSEAALARGGLEAYAQHPLLRTVSVDRSAYRPLTGDDIAEYEHQVAHARTLSEARPETAKGALTPFRMLYKVWDELTTAVFPEHPRYGARAGSPNSAFLDADRLASEVLAPFATAGVSAEARGPFLVQLTPMPTGFASERALVAKVDDFLSRVPAGHRWAVELRNAELFGPRWLDMLAAHRAAHVFTYWTAMPSLRDQLRAFRRGNAKAAPFAVVRLMLPPYTRYASRRAQMAPFDKLVELQPEMRADVIDVLRAVAEAGCEEGFVLVNNKAEGSAPLTVRGLAKMTADAFDARSSQ